jgi:hypothetical protein
LRGSVASNSSAAVLLTALLDASALAAFCL